MSLMRKDIVLPPGEYMVLPSVGRRVTRIKIECHLGGLPLVLRAGLV